MKSLGGGSKENKASKIDASENDNKMTTNQGLFLGVDGGKSADWK